MKLIFDESDEMINPKRTDYTTSFKQTDKLARIGKVHENMNSAVILHMKIARYVFLPKQFVDRNEISEYIVHQFIL